MSVIYEKNEMRCYSKPDDISDRKPAEKIHEESIKYLFLSKRFCIVTLLFLGNMMISLMKLNLNIAIVEMTSKKKIVTGNLIRFEEPDFAWDSKTIGFVQSSLPYGNLFCGLAVPLVKKFGGAVTVGASMMGVAILNVTTSIIVYASFLLFFTSRMIVGLLEGIGYLAILETLSHWVPPKETTIMSCFCLYGLEVGAAIAYPICGFIAERWGWEAVFYIIGYVGVIWSTTWLLVAKNNPSEDKFISKEELQYLLGNKNTKRTPKEKVVHPYKKIFTSSPVWAMFVGKLAFVWGYSLLLVGFPLYVKDMTGCDIEEVGLIASIPNLVCIFSMPLAGLILDILHKISSFNLTQIHKTIMSGGFISCCIFFIIASSNVSFTLSTICFICIKFVYSFHFLVLQVLILYMSPTHTTVLAAISTVAFLISDVTIPIFVGFIVQNHSLDEWNNCFRLTAAVQLLGGLIYWVHGSSELQPWSMPITSDAQENEI